MIPWFDYMLIGKALNLPKVQNHTIICFARVIGNNTHQSHFTCITMTMQMAALTIMVWNTMARIKL
jgi:hypothetical protein